jgi:hypothetical protein
MPKIFNPKNFKDPVAQNTEWTPVFKDSNGNFKVKRIIEEAGGGKLGFQKSTSSKSLYRNCVFLGLVAFAYMVISNNQVLMLRVFSLLAVVVGLWGMSLQNQPFFFDKASGIFKNGRKQTVKFDDVYALQLLSREVQVKAPPKGELKKIKTYELNLVLNDGKRVNVLAHGGFNEIKEDSDIISRFIDKPLWDAAV